MAEWIEVQLIDILEEKGYIRGPFGSDLKRGDMKTEGVPVYEQQHAIYNGRQFRYFIDEQKFSEMKRFQVKNNDLIISCSGTVGKVSIIRNDDPKGIISQALLLLRVNTEKILPLYLKYFFSSREGYNAIVSRSSGSVQVNLSKRNVIEKIPVKLPPLSTQQKIVDILSVIDGKIEENEKVNNNLEQQAQAIFKSWFVDYEPSNGKIPSDWKEYKLRDFLPVITGKKNANVSSNSGLYPFFSCSQDITWTNEYSFEGGAILVAGNGDFNVKFYNGKFEAYQRTYVLIPHNPRFSAWLFYAVKYNLNKITAAARGSVIKFITKGNLEDFSFYAPLNLDDFDVIDQFTAINNIVASNREENARLADLRDTLLPKLMSGELDISNLDF